eukprot:CAMPEP_0171506054 /NCGR_PEP_ID=MMETSP0958-20121227/12664_1 /TAXON_ID=87120 /ORGANISM="Aurantiochytrium limacinum, Strain ATCCMYA-1381" /LENGTH=567 /DNA_ID=CAMNT_0012042465 /DNA_START=143 /DNA_END=1847 /DNA_ORIENTATION=+
MNENDRLLGEEEEDVVLHREQDDLEYISQFLARMLGQPLRERYSVRRPLTDNEEFKSPMYTTGTPTPTPTSTAPASPVHLAPQIRDSDDDDEDEFFLQSSFEGTDDEDEASALSMQRLSVRREEDKIASRLPRSIAKLTEVRSDGLVKEVKIDDEVYAITEITLLHSLKHDNIIKLIGATIERNEEGTRILAVTEFMAGGSLTEAIKADKASASMFSWAHRLRVCVHIASAVKFLHERGIMHRDVKPENVLLNMAVRHMSASPPGALVAKLADFGMARGTYNRNEIQEGSELAAQHKPRMSVRTRRQTICGTEEFMAPELLFSTPYTASVDVFAFGGLLAEVATGRALGRHGFMVRKPEDSFQLDFSQLETYAIKGCPTSLLRLTEQCMSYESSDRLQPIYIVDWLEELESEVDTGETERIISSVNERTSSARELAKAAKSKSSKTKGKATKRSSGSSATSSDSSKSSKSSKSKLAIDMLPPEIAARAAIMNRVPVSNKATPNSKVQVNEGSKSTSVSSKDAKQLASTRAVAANGHAAKNKSPALERTAAKSTQGSSGEAGGCCVIA